MDSVKYSLDHVWLRLEHDNCATVGVTHFAQEQLGDIVFVQLPNIGDTIAKGEECGVVESVKTASSLVMPATGEVIELNTQLLEEPWKINQSPLGSGWLFKMDVTDVGEVERMMDQHQYAEFIGQREQS
jgi:glycine cleavage system H protein